MFAAFLRGLLTVLAALVIIVLVVMTVIWIKEQIKKRIAEKNAHKVIFAETSQIIDEEMKQRIIESDEVSMDDLESMCDRSPFVMATYDSESGKIFDYTGIQPENVQPALREILHNNGGWVVVEE